ncbi:MAG: DegT/DnrJ/EryC1/StrS family aminotransferase [Pseudomonadota bacterium]|nr:DegT/DnrJ/EryC1/StrS family aminotransferase [Pseudomonadota bacterium]
MTKYRIPFSGRAHTYTKDEIQTVIDVMQTAVPLTQGQHQQDFEEKFCEYSGAKHAFAVNNATAALELSAQLCQFTQGDEVIIPAHTFTASAYPFLKKGAKIVWADIDLKTRVVTAQTIEKCITKNTKAIVVVHLYGFCAEMPPIMKLAKKHNLFVVEDAAQAIGSRIKGQMAGTFGDLGVYSFHSHKNITTLGEGGMLVVKNQSLAELIPMLRHNGHCGYNFERKHYWLPAMSKVDLPELNGKPIWPNNHCLGEIECALGVKLLNRIDKINEQKRQRAIRFIDAMAEYSQLEFHREETERHNYHLLVARVTNSERDTIMTKMAEAGVQCVVQYYPLNRYDLYKKSGFGEANCSNTDLFFDNMISFPFEHMMSDETFTELISITKKVITNLQ